LDDEYCNDDILPLCDAEFEDLRLQMRALCPVLCDACEPEVAFTYPELDCADKDEFEYKVALALATVLPNEIKAESVVTYCGDAPDIDVPTDVPTENRRRSVTGLTVVVTAIDDASAATIVAAVTDGTPSGEALNVTLDSVADTFYYPSLVVRTTSTSTSSTSTSTSTSTTTIIYDPCNAGEFRSTSEPFTNGTCTACPVGTYQTGQTYATQCNSYSACSSGQYRPNPDADASTFAFCTPCAAGEVKETSGTYDSVCAPYSTCEDGVTFSPNDADVAADTDRICTPVTNCTTDQYVVQAPTLTQNRVCASYSDPCDNSYEYELVAPSDTDDRVCTNYTVFCQENATYETSSQTPSEERVCAPVSICSGGQYVTAFPTLVADTGCADFSTCEYDTHTVLYPDASTYDHRFGNTADETDGGGVATEDIQCILRETCDPIFDDPAEKTEIATNCPAKPLTQKSIFFNSDVSNIPEDAWKAFIVSEDTGGGLERDTNNDPVGVFANDPDFTADPCTTDPIQGAKTIGVDLHWKSFEVVEDSDAGTWTVYFNLLFEPTDAGCTRRKKRSQTFTPRGSAHAASEKLPLELGSAHAASEKLPLELHSLPSVPRNGKEEHL
jgi:hypothetical protein